jgi:hypothetical protein
LGVVALAAGGSCGAKPENIKSTITPAASLGRRANERATPLASSALIATAWPAAAQDATGAATVLHGIRLRSL